MAWDGTVRHGTAPYSMGRHGLAWDGTDLCGLSQYGIGQHRTLGAVTVRHVLVAHQAAQVANTHQSTEVSEHPIV